MKYIHVYANIYIYTCWYTLGGASVYHKKQGYLPGPGLRPHNMADMPYTKRLVFICAPQLRGKSFIHSHIYIYLSLWKWTDDWWPSPNNYGNAIHLLTYARYAPSWREKRKDTKLRYKQFSPKKSWMPDHMVSFFSNGCWYHDPIVAKPCQKKHPFTYSFRCDSFVLPARQQAFGDTIPVLPKPLANKCQCPKVDPCLSNKYSIFTYPKIYPNMRFSLIIPASICLSPNVHLRSHI